MRSIKRWGFVLVLALALLFVMRATTNSNGSIVVSGADFGSSIGARTVLGNNTASTAAPAFTTTADALAYQTAEIPAFVSVCSAGGTGCSGTSFTTSGVGTGLEVIPGLTWTVPANTALNVPFSCHVTYHQNAGTATISLGIQDVTIAPTNLGIEAWMILGGATLGTDLVTNVVAFTNTGQNIILSGTPAAITTNHQIDVYGFLEQPSNGSASAIQLQVSTATAGDTVTIVRGSFCQLN